MEAFFGALGSYGHTLGATMNAEVQNALFHAEARHYDSTLEARARRRRTSRSASTAPGRRGGHRTCRLFHRYLKLRKRMLGVDELHYYDLYAPLVRTCRSTTRWTRPRPTSRPR